MNQENKTQRKSEKLAASKTFAVNLLSATFPCVSMAKEAVSYWNNISNIILRDKIAIVLCEQDTDFDEWLKLACDFQADSAKYHHIVKQLIYVIDSINDDSKLYVYANLLRAYKVGLLGRNLFFKLASMLPSVFYDDLLFLKNCVEHEVSEIFEDGNFFSVAYGNLLNFGLMYCTTEGLWIDTRGSKKFRITKPGLEMVRCGVDYENYEKYRNIKIVYEIHESDLQPMSDEDADKMLNEVLGGEQWNE